MLDEDQLEFTKAFEQFVHKKIMDKVKGLFGLHVFDKFVFHIAESKIPKEVWDKLAKFYGKDNQFKILQLEVDLTSIFIYYFSLFMISLHNLSCFYHN